MNQTTLLTQEIREIFITEYEKVLEIKDPSVGLHAIIAIHSTTLGPALGGCRMYPYRNFEEGLNDCLRLSKGMTEKWAVNGVGFGGGKAVIFGDPKTKKTPALLEAFGRAVDRLQGIYITAEDSGIYPQDLLHIRKGTKYIVGIRREGSSGDPSPFTAWGVFRSIQATCKALFNHDSVKDKVIAIQGLGNVGEPLTELLFWHGARLKVADIDTEKAERIAKKFGAVIEDPADILRTECDILSPCAMGAVFNDQTILQLRCKGIAGSANNMLGDSYHGQMLQNQGILYAPDFIANSGGAIHVSHELEKHIYDPVKARKQVDEIYDLLLQIFSMASSKKISTIQAALTITEYKLKNKIGARQQPVYFHH